MPPDRAAGASDLLPPHRHQHRRLDHHSVRRFVGDTTESDDHLSDPSLDLHSDRHADYSQLAGLTASKSVPDPRRKSPPSLRRYWRLTTTQAKGLSTTNLASLTTNEIDH